MSRIFTVQLRTTDIERARAFYSVVLDGQDFVSFALPEQALARGARPHWLGYIDVPELGAALSAFVDRGATQLGPRFRTDDGLDAAAIRDPGGAVVALSNAPAGGSRRGPEVAWYQLNTAHVARAKDYYRELCGWRFEASESVPGAGVVNHPFAWRQDGAPIGAMADIADRPGVHAHWLYHFRVPSLDRALEKVRALGGLALPPIELSSGTRVGVCDDAQGAAFALVEKPA